ncbi:hypothetical protein [Sunxiuqinia sp. sy24]|uniref:hypothetical protein n=1 Tax=Sunxiuqinia sp. sy24 TaxID=3461495 RepID=UPI00404530C2
MEKSIENIWKEGFLKSDALVAPTIDKLYKQKSNHIIDKFKRMFKVNLIAIVAFSFVFLVVSFLAGIPLMGAIFFVSLAVLVVVNKRLFDDLKKIDKGGSSYEYLKAFNQWIEKQVAINKNMSTFLYPVFFLSFIIGFWFKNTDGIPLGEKLLKEVLVRFPDVHLFYGIPLVGLVAVLILVGLLAFFGGRIYLWDLNLIYGRVFKKLEELMADIEELKNSTS